eukprot:scaffold2637_cov421-Pavlova_lutheri.AAC.5
MEDLGTRMEENRKAENHAGTLSEVEYRPERPCSCGGTRVCVEKTQRSPCDQRKHKKGRTNSEEFLHHNWQMKQGSGGHQMLLSGKSDATSIVHNRAMQSTVGRPLDPKEGAARSSILSGPLQTMLQEPCITFM